MLFVVSTNSIFQERIPDETNFLHGLGQDVLSWQGVQFALSPLHSKTFDIFSHPKESYQEVKERLMERLQQESEPFILVGLSLGGVLALDLSRQDFPQLKGLVLAGTQYKLNTNPLYRLQILLFRLLPKHVFENKMPINNRCFKS